HPEVVDANRLGGGRGLAARAVKVVGRHPGPGVVALHHHGVGADVGSVPSHCRDLARVGGRRPLEAARRRTSGGDRRPPPRPCCPPPPTGPTASVVDAATTRPSTLAIRRTISSLSASTRTRSISHAPRKLWQAGWADRDGSMSEVTRSERLKPKRGPHG